jgi:glycosyltransferase involved in cell wall biosynthesis
MNGSFKMKTAILHYSVPPVIGGVESVITAHANQFINNGLPLKIIAGRGEIWALPKGVEFARIPEMDTLHPEISAATTILNNGNIPENFDILTTRLVEKLRLELANIDNLIVHNILTKHFNLPLTTAIFQLMDEGVIKHMLAWCHDLTWTSPNSRSKVFPSYPWNLLKTVQKNTIYIAISKKRQDEIIETFGLSRTAVPIIHNGVDSNTLLALSDEGSALINRLNLWSADLMFFMPVRVTEAKNIEFAMRVTASLLELKINPKLVISGPPDPHDNTNMKYFNSLLSLRRDLKLENNVHFIYEAGPDPKIGYMISQLVVSELYRVADAMFMPSHREGFGMPILEAGLLGLPIISTEVPAVQDLQLTEALIFSKDTRPSELARKIFSWLNEKPEHRLRVEVRQNFTWKSLFDRKILPLLTEDSTI